MEEQQANNKEKQQQQANNEEKQAELNELSINCKCKICFEKFSKVRRYPITLCCGHTFCATCIQILSNINRNKILCGVCRKQSFCRAGKNILLFEILVALNLLDNTLDDIAASDAVPELKAQRSQQHRIFWNSGESEDELFQWEANQWEAEERITVSPERFANGGFGTGGNYDGGWNIDSGTWALSNDGFGETNNTGWADNTNSDALVGFSNGGFGENSTNNNGWADNTNYDALVEFSNGGFGSNLRTTMSNMQNNGNWNRNIRRRRRRRIGIGTPYRYNNPRPVQSDDEWGSSSGWNSNDEAAGHGNQPEDDLQQQQLNVEQPIGNMGIHREEEQLEQPLYAIDEDDRSEHSVRPPTRDSLNMDSELVDGLNVAITGIVASFHAADDEDDDADGIGEADQAADGFNTNAMDDGQQRVEEPNVHGNDEQHEQQQQQGGGGDRGAGSHRHQYDRPVKITVRNGGKTYRYQSPMH